MRKTEARVEELELLECGELPRAASPPQGRHTPSTRNIPPASYCTSVSAIHLIEAEGDNGVQLFKSVSGLYNPSSRDHVSPSSPDRCFRKHFDGGATSSAISPKPMLDAKEARSSGASSQQSGPALRP